MRSWGMADCRISDSIIISSILIENFTQLSSKSAFVPPLLFPAATYSNCLPGIKYFGVLRR